MPTPREWQQRIQKIWAESRYSPKMDWLGMENDLSQVLLPSDDFTDAERVRLCRELIDAYTRRGHFKPEDY